MNLAEPVLIKESMTLVTLREFSIRSAVKHLKLPVTDDFAGVVKIPKLLRDPQKDIRFGIFIFVVLFGYFRDIY
jgi:hypothetical protein